MDSQTKGTPPLSGHMIWWSTLGAKNQCRQEHQMSTVFSMFWFFDVCILNLNEPLLSLYIYIYHYISPSNPYSHVCLVGHHFAIKILVAIIGYNWTILHRKGNTHDEFDIQSLFLSSNDWPTLLIYIDWIECKLSLFRSLFFMVELC